MASSSSLCKAAGFRFRLIIGILIAGGVGSGSGRGSDCGNILRGSPDFFNGDFLGERTLAGPRVNFFPFATK